MGGEGLKRLARAVPAVLLALLDAFVLRQGLIVLGLALYGTLRWYFPGKNGRLVPALSLVSALFAMAAIATHFAALEKRAAATVKAIQAFHAAEGRYPDTLQQLIPRHLAELPAKVRYRAGVDGHRVEYGAYSPLFLTLRYYRMEDGKWQTLVD